jgi:hypothetical protein
MISAVLEKIAPWRNAALMVVLVGLLLTAFQVPEARTSIAHGLIYGFGPLLALLAWTRVQDGSLALSLSWLVLGSLIGCAGAYAAHHGISPGEPLAEIRLGGVDEAEEIPLLSDGAFRLRIQGDLEGGQRENTRAPYVLEVSRGDARVLLRGELYREVREEGARGGAPQRTTSLHRTEMHDRTLGGRGPTTVRVVSVENLHGPQTILLFAPFGFEPWWLLVLGVLALATHGLEVMSARAHTWTPLTAVMGLTLVLGQYVAMKYDIDQPLITFLGGFVFSGVVGGVGGTASGLAVNWAVMRLRSGKGTDT